MSIDECISQANESLEQINSNLLIISNNINDDSTEKIENDQQNLVEEYYNIENSNINTNTQSSMGNFNMGYEAARSNINLVNADELKEYFLANGGKVINDQTIEISINGATYQYNTKTESLFINGENYIGCRFYKTANTSLGNINNTITVLPGSGEVRYGAVKRDAKDNKNALSNDLNINDGSLVIVPYFQKKDYYNMYRQPDKIIDATYFGNFLSNGSTNTKNHVRNSIVGFSMGSTAAFPLAVSAPNDYYSCIVAVDLGSYMQKIDGSYFDTISAEDYNKIKNMEFIFMSTNGNDPWQDKSMSQTYHNLKSNGANNIIFYTSADKALNPKIGNGMYYIEDAINTKDIWPYDKHNHGYKLIDSTNILSYLSSNDRGKV